MKDSSTGPWRASGAETRPYRWLSLVQLLVRIVRHADRLALRELHDHRPCFRLGAAVALLLADFVHGLSLTQWARRLTTGVTSILDYARDLTIDRFTVLPQGFPPALPSRGGGPDCRRCFGAVLTRIGDWSKENPDAAPHQEEGAAAAILQKAVVRHFAYSCREARRDDNPADSRYAWSVNGGAIRVSMPRWMSGHRRRAWLEAHVDDPDPARPDEQERVQSIVDRELGVPHRVPLADAEAGEWLGRPGAAPMDAAMAEEISLRGLPQAVADEKAGPRLDDQRPAIRRLGAANVRCLVLLIFEQLAEGRYEEKRIADAFGISRATLSRFAGSQWQAISGDAPPDLWANVAQVLASYEPFTEAAKQAGVWDQVQMTLQNTR